VGYRKIMPSMLGRLKNALDLLRFDPAARPNERVNLFFALKSHALHRNDKELEAACDAEIAKIQEERRQELEALQGPGTRPPT